MRSSLTRVEKVRIYPNPSQIRAFERILWTCCTLYNGSLQERRDAYKRYKLAGKPKDFVWPNFKHQTSILTLARKENIWLKTVYSETLADVLKKIDVAMSDFMSRVSKGEKAGYPRFRASRRYDTFTYPHGERAIKFFEKTVKFPKEIGFVKYRKSGRDMPEKFGVVRISRHAGRWYACFEHVIEARLLVSSKREVGVDVGIANYAALSTEEFIPNGTWDRNGNSEHHHRSISSKKKGSKRRRKSVLLLSKSKAREKRQRDDFLHKHSRLLVQNYGLIALEKLQILNMVRSAKGTIDEPGKKVSQKAGLNRSILDAAWGRFVNMIAYKAEEAGRKVVLVNPKNTSITCFPCRYVSKENRKSQSEFMCISCGHKYHADINAAKNILFLARSELAVAA